MRDSRSSESQPVSAPLAQLADIANYRPCEWDLKRDAAGRRYWIDVFRSHSDALIEAIRSEYPDAEPERLAEFREEYQARILAVDASPEDFERIDILLLDQIRTELEKSFGFDDPYRSIKQKETAAALEVLPGLLAELDAGGSAEETVEMLARGLMAGNLFDLGAHDAVRRYQDHNADFQRLRASQPPHPWLIDHVDHWANRWRQGEPYRHVAFFVDNAGGDVCLGCLPLARWMIDRGARVSLVANSGPALNDVTAPELIELVGRVGQIDGRLRAAAACGRLSVIASGCGAPLLDLSALRPECAAGISDADLLILHGMGRSVESNFSARFTCDVLRTAVLKDSAIARGIGGKLFDCVWRFDIACRGA